MCSYYYPKYINNQLICKNLGSNLERFEEKTGLQQQKEMQPSNQIALCIISGEISVKYNTIKQKLINRNKC